MTLDSSPSSTGPEHSSADLAAARTSLQTVAKEIARAVMAIQVVEKLAAEPNSTHIKLLESIDKAQTRLSRLPPALAESALKQLDVVHKAAGEGERQRQETLATSLAALLDKRGLKLRGNLPLLEVGVFRLEVRANDVRIWFGPQRESLGTTGKSAPAIAAFLDGMLESLRPSPLDEDTFLTQLYAAYRAAHAAADSAPDQPIRLDAVMRQLIIARQDASFTQHQRLRGYSRAQFGYDLYRLKNRTYRGRQLQLIAAAKSHTIKAADSVWVPTDDHGGGALYSQITFRDDAQ